MGDFGSEERSLFESSGIALYEEIVTMGGISVDDPRLASDSPERATFDLLIDLGLLHADGETLIPEDPTTAQARVVSPMSAEGARLVDESSRWNKGFASVAQTWRSSAASEERGPFTYLRSKAIGPYLIALAAECQTELLTAQPQTGRDTGQAYSGQVTQAEREALGRGARLLTLYQHSARRSNVTRDYAAAVAELGGEVRTLDEFFNRMIVVDRRVAVIPSPDDLSVALAIREPAIVAYLADVFLRAWERARPFNARDDKAMRQIAEEQRAMTMRMLIEGHSDPVSAKRLGVSPRTYAGYISDLKEEFEAETRFQLGYTIGQHGITTESLASDDS